MFESHKPLLKQNLVVSNNSDITKKMPREFLQLKEWIVFNDFPYRLLCESGCV